MDYTGCGNTLDFDNPWVIRMVMDSLRYWVEVMHVDGFRFDLASALGREEGRFDKASSFFSAIHQDPVLSRAKLIAEPWDITGEGYQVGNFPVDWSEWNGRYRDCLRKAVKSDGGLVPELASRLTGSADLYGDDGRTPYNSINFITCHDGFTLWDVVSYAGKHNEANGENNRDGADNNSSWSWGIEGETDDPAVNAIRRRLVRNFATLLLVSQGIPMILGGDEFCRTQGGNNNAYCQDNKISWFDWERAKKNKDMVSFFRDLIALRRRHPVFRRKSFFAGEDRDRDNIKDITWHSPDLSSVNWADPQTRAFAFRIDGSECTAESREADRDFFILVNNHWEDITFTLPDPPHGYAWHRVVDTAGAGGAASPGSEPKVEGKHYPAAGRSVVVLMAK
jgi:glycogen operon protein